MAVTRLRNGTMSRRDLLENRYKNTRWNILIVAIATMINVILVTGDTYGEEKGASQRDKSYG